MPIQDYKICVMLLFFTLLFGLLSGCQTDQATVQLIDIPVNQLEGFMPWLATDHPTEEEETRLSLLGIYALDQHTVFLYGAFDAQPDDQRSVLLRSIDGGRTWQETMIPRGGSAITQRSGAEKSRLGSVMGSMLNNM